MRCAQLALVLGSLTLLSSACGDDDDTMVTVDARPPVPDSRPMVDAPPMADAPPVVNAANLGQPCSAMAACPTGYQCIAIGMGQTMGFCTIPCGGQMDMTTCMNGFPGPGAGVCNLSDGMMMNFCSVACGEQIMGGSTDCPAGTMCRDLIMSMADAAAPDTCYP